MNCACGHSKSEHGKQGCEFEQCKCRKFRIKKESPGKEQMLKAMTAAGKLKVDSIKQFEKFAEPMRKGDEVQGRRSDIQDSFEEHFTNIRELGSDYKQKIAECDILLKDFA